MAPVSHPAHQPFAPAPQQQHYIAPPEPMASLQTQQSDRFTVRAPFTQGYSEEPPSRVPVIEEKKAWQVSDDAPRYAPPGTSEADLDPFGLAALPEQQTYHGPKEIPSEAVYGLLFGLCSLLLFPLAFLGFARSRRASSMIEAAPTRFKGRIVVLAGFAFNVVCPLLSVAAGTYFFRLI